MRSRRRRGSIKFFVSSTWDSVLKMDVRLWNGGGCYIWDEILGQIGFIMMCERGGLAGLLHGAVS